MTKAVRNFYSRLLFCLQKMLIFLGGLHMKLKQKFTLLALMVGIIVLLVPAIGFMPPCQPAAIGQNV